jgi:MscS family membrane protein
MARNIFLNKGECHRRPHIRRLTNIAITYDTPPEKNEQAVNIILSILDDHEGVDENFPPKAFFNEFNSGCLRFVSQIHKK